MLVQNHDFLILYLHFMHPLRWAGVSDDGPNFWHQGRQMHGAKY